MPPRSVFWGLRKCRGIGISGPPKFQQNVRDCVLGRYSVITACQPTPVQRGAPLPHKCPSASADVWPPGGAPRPARIENSALTIPMGVGVPKPDVSWILHNFKTNGFGESLHLGTEQPQSSSPGRGQARPEGCLDSGHALCPGTGGMKFPDQPCSRPASCLRSQERQSSLAAPDLEE